MQVALSLQYFPIDGVSPPITVCTTTEPSILRQYRRLLLKAHERRADLARRDPTAFQLAGTEVEQLRRVLDLLLPEGGHL